MNPTAFSRTIRILFLLCSVMLAASPALWAADYKEDVTGEDYLYVRGKVHAVTPGEQSVTVKPAKGARITIIVEQQTEFSGFKTIDSLRPDENVKVWHRPTNKGHIGLKIIRLPDLGC